MLTSTWHYSVAMCRWFYSLTSRGNIFIRGALATTPPPLNTHKRTHAHARVTSWFPKQQAATSLPAPSLSPVFSHSIYPFISSHLPPHLLPLSPFKSPLRHKVFSSWQLLCACVRIMCCSWTAAVSLISFSSSVFLSSNCAMDATINSCNDEIWGLWISLTLILLKAVMKTLILSVIMRTTTMTKWWWNGSGSPSPASAVCSVNAFVYHRHHSASAFIYSTSRSSDIEQIRLSMHAHTWCNAREFSPKELCGCIEAISL